jgi:hypothetical protein
LLEGCRIVTFCIPDRLLVASGPFGAALPAAGLPAAGLPAAGLPAARVAAAIARGLQAGGLPEPDLCPIEEWDGAKGDAGEATRGLQDLRGLLDALDFDARMRRARAVIIAAERLREPTLAGSVTFEIATRARQGGVPAYAVTAENALDAFDARILDLQLILEARSARSLAAAGRRLARLV